MADAMQDPKDPYLVEAGHSMRCLLAVAVKEAVKLALIDSVLADEMDEVIERDGVDAWLERRGEVVAAWRHDIHAIPSRHIARMDPMALAQNVACRLLGSGGWFVGGIYAGNATPREVFEAAVGRPGYSAVDELAFDLGLTPDDRGDDA